MTAPQTDGQQILAGAQGRQIPMMPTRPARVRQAQNTSMGNGGGLTFPGQQMGPLAR
jgi:hypothetical protein